MRLSADTRLISSAACMTTWRDRWEQIQLPSRPPGRSVRSIPRGPRHPGLLLVSSSKTKWSYSNKTKSNSSGSTRCYCWILGSSPISPGSCLSPNSDLRMPRRLPSKHLVNIPIPTPSWLRSETSTGQRISPGMTRVISGYVYNPADVILVKTSDLEVSWGSTFWQGGLPESNFLIKGLGRVWHCQC